MVLFCIVLILVGVDTTAVRGQGGVATIEVFTQEIKTYPFGDPDPNPILLSNAKIYPYHKFDGYSHDPIMKEWQVVKLENDYVEVYILPEIGGKVWGAVEKSTGHEFIYRNEVIKFRNISMRGPWTSGGIEFNFGIIGHHPSTASPVDFYTQENEDGSVSCTVGAIDLPSRTQWRVEVMLPVDKAFFETRVLWYNPTHSDQSYYNWMTGAARASDDLQFFCPGDQFVGHPGDVHPWPIDDHGRDISRYDENRFGGSKSYHVVGEYNDFFGGYYHDSNVGFGHWSPYEEMPGQKLWLWALSRSGGIWEDLLTDTDGQYIEFQAGRLFNQYSPGQIHSPITQVNFEPGRADIWREVWFPIKDIGGLTDVSTKGVLHVVESDTSIRIGINALEAQEGQILVTDGLDTLLFDTLHLLPMEVAFYDAQKSEEINIEVKGFDLTYRGSSQRDLLRRSFDNREEGTLTSAHDWFRAAEENIKFRDFAEARKKLLRCISLDKNHLEAYVSLADLEWRSVDHERALDYIKVALQKDTYHYRANFVAGKIYQSLGQRIDALECYGWAARSLQYRSDAYVGIAELYARQSRWDDAIRYARNALDFNKYHLRARSILMAGARVQGNLMSGVQQISTVRAIDPLHHLARAEQYLLSNHPGDKAAFVDSHQSEYTDQTFLEVALFYYSLNRVDDARNILSLAPKTPITIMWQAFLADNKVDQRTLLGRLEELPATLVFPYRAETLSALKWAATQSDHWKVKYYLALNLWGLGQQSEAKEIFLNFDNNTPFVPLLICKADLMDDGDSKLAVLLSALEMDKENWRTWDMLIQYYEKNRIFDRQLVAAEKAVVRFQDHYAIKMRYAQSLINNREHAAAIEVLRGINVLPYEGAHAGRTMWENAHHGTAIDLIGSGEYAKAEEVLLAGRTWPESLGVGRPFDVDHRISDYLMYQNYRHWGNMAKAEKYFKALMTGVARDRNTFDKTDLVCLSVEVDDDIRGILASKMKASDGALVQYARAFMRNDKEKMEEVSKDYLLFENSSDRLIFDAIKLQTNGN